ncbi:MAG: hypothetical protein OEY93_02385 [Anaerolineae bacterium]|nr:hypothetical protein [Anaerolineae bacterium]
MSHKINSLKFAAGKFNFSHIRLIIMLVTLILLVLGSGAPEIGSGGGVG